MSSTERETPSEPAGRAETGGGSVSIHAMSGGSVSTGSHGVATSVNTTAPGPGPEHRELLDAIRALRRALPREDRSAADTVLDGELAEAEAEIVRDGTADRGSLTRLLVGVRGWLGTNAAAAGAVASATAVVQGIAQLLV
ncbi:hypothetical protein ACFWDI_08385 [Streptomyces sp. NPDC060064]|uniref:hypothetical protein n=1 Tax=Streptomyces sp. NPDC060064 TaxID=3347049 RepID=UPI0036AAF6F8